MKGKFLTAFMLIINTLVFGQDVSAIEASKIAVNYINNMSTYKGYSSDEIIEVISNKSEGVITYYTVIFKEKGFVNISSTRFSKPILSYSETKYVDTLENPAYKIWMQSYAVQIIKIKEKFKEDPQSMQEAREWDILLNNKIESVKSAKSVATPLITSKWGQSITNDNECDGYNYYVTETTSNCTSCPSQKCPAGCVAVAMAQVANYWMHPVHPTYQDYDWCNMPNSLYANDNTNYTTERNAIAELIKDCGIEAGMNYCKGNNCTSSSVPSRALEGMEALGYSGDLKWNIWYSESTWKRMLIDDLDQGRPIIYSGGHFGINDTYGHTFVCDGYKSDGLGDYLFHFNWGWNGSYNNSWFSIGNLNPGVLEFNLLNSGIFELTPETEVDCDYSSVDLGEYYNQNESYFYQMHGYYPLSPPWPWNLIQPVAAEVETADLSSREDYRHIPAGYGCTYRAYKSITINPGFQVDQGATFSAIIIPCPNDCN
ncbi:MAG: C10 family peptidase [Bacteroidales bacterium]|nr:C10 family peptidase [Bacteroidales bacterium]MDT8431031.1 C10 family peptidase [Bacteroidales bacterium]